MRPHRSQPDPEFAGHSENAILIIKKNVCWNVHSDNVADVAEHSFQVYTTDASRIFVHLLTAAYGTKLPCRRRRPMSEAGGRTDDADMPPRPILTHCGSRAGNLAVMHNGSSSYVLGWRHETTGVYHAHRRRGRWRLARSNPRCRRLVSFVSHRPRPRGISSRRSSKA